MLVTVHWAQSDTAPELPEGGVRLREETGEIACRAASHGHNTRPMFFRRLKFSPA